MSGGWIDRDWKPGEAIPLILILLIGLTLLLGLLSGFLVGCFKWTYEFSSGLFSMEQDALTYAGWW